MEGFGWIMTVVLGGFAGWIASRLMNAGQGLVMNIVMGILGAVVMNSLLEFVLHRTWGGFVGQLATAVIGACALIWAWRMVRSRG